MVEKFLCVCRKRDLRTEELHLLIIGLRATGTAVAGCRVRQSAFSAAAALFNAAPNRTQDDALVSTQAADRLPAIF
jgi:hypothetical protein